MDILCLDFINTQWYTKNKPSREYLDDDVWIAEFNEKWDLPQVKVTEAYRNDLFILRDFLFHVATDIAKGLELSSDDIQKVNTYLKKVNYTVGLKQKKGIYEMVQSATAKSTDAVIFYIVQSFVKMISEHPVERIKVCENPSCDWIYYDDSKNKTRKWCGNTCASLIKVRKYRSKNDNKRK